MKLSRKKNILLIGSSGEIANAIINKSKSAYLLAKQRAQNAQRQRDAIRNANREINNIKSEMHEIKSMLKTLLDKN